MSFRARLHSNAKLIGTMISIASQDNVDILSMCGFDWYFLDLEHSTMSHEQAKGLLQVVANRIPVLARVAANNDLEIKKALDMGADGIIVPLVKNKVEAEAAVRAAKYPPEG